MTELYGSLLRGPRTASLQELASSPTEHGGLPGLWQTGVAHPLVNALSAFMVSNRCGRNRQMARRSRFCNPLPVAQCGLTALFEGFGLWQRSVILSRPFFEGQTLWNSTARFHGWPWSYKFAAVSNLPAVLAGSLASLPLAVIWPSVSEYAADLSALLFVPLLWYWVGYRLDRRWCVADNTPWIALPVFTAGCLGGAFLPLGHAGFLPYGFMIWVITTFSVSRLTRTAHVVNELVISGDGRPCRGLKNSDYQFIGESEEHYRQLIAEKHRNPRNHVRMRRRILCQLH